MSSDEEILKIYEDNDAVWFHNGDPQAPHAVLTSDFHSDGYVNSTEVMKKPWIVARLARELVGRIRQHKALVHRPYCIVGSPYAAITFSFEVARQLHVRHCF